MPTHGPTEPSSPDGSVNPSALPRARAGAQLALTALGLRSEGPFDPLPSGEGRPGRQAVRATVATAHGRAEVAIKVVLDPSASAARSFAWEHQVARMMGGVAERMVRDGDLLTNPIVRVLHDEPIDLGDALAAVSRFAPSTGAPLTARRWAETLALLHCIGSTPTAVDLLRTHPVTNALAGLNAETFLNALDLPGHPFRNRRSLVLELAYALKERTLYALDLDPTPLLVHRDLHPRNCINTIEGVVVIDWQEAGWGNRSDDFAWTYLLVNRYAGSPKIMDEAKRAYRNATGGTCPTDEQIKASGQVRELLCLGYSIQNAHRSPEHLAEALVELPILADPNARTRPWRALFNPAIFTPGLLLSPASSDRKTPHPPPPASTLNSKGSDQ